MTTNISDAIKCAIKVLEETLSGENTVTCLEISNAIAVLKNDLTAKETK